jgi:hypothetical protein
LALVFAAPRSDDPGSASDESDAPVSQIDSVIPYIELTSLAESGLTLPASVWLEYELRAPDLRAVATTHFQVKPDSLSSFLCTFVC